MILDRLRPEHQESVMDLFCQVFQDDAYYVGLMPDASTRQAKMRLHFSGPIAYCLRENMSLGLWDGGRLIGFLLCFDYQGARGSEEVFENIFGSDRSNAPFQRADALIGEMNRMPGGTLFLLSVAVEPAWRQKGLAESMLDALMRRFPGRPVAGDVSNPLTVGMYEKRNFTVRELSAKYYFVHYDPAVPPHTALFGETMRVLVPETDFLRSFHISFAVSRESRYLSDGEKRVSCGVPGFVRREGAMCPAVEVEMDYAAFLQYQRVINPNQCDEDMLGNCVLYWNLLPYREKPLYNDTLLSLIADRGTEWSLIPDMYVLIPMQYRDADLLKPVPDDLETSQLLRSMDFRTRFELGMLVDDAAVDDYSGLKKRLKRIYLGKFLLQATGEILIRQEGEEPPYIGPPAYVDMFITADTRSGCAVLTWYSLSSPFLVSHMLDCVSRRQVQVVHEQGKENLFAFLSREYGLTKQGKPKAALILPRENTCLKPSQLASMLAGETIYADGEAYGIINDREMLSAASADHTIGQYNRGALYAYSTVLIQFSPDLRASIQDRLQEESILLFYMELLLIEEAAIHIANQAIMRLLADTEMKEPVAFLEQVSSIYDDYCKTADFWSVQANYPSSQRSLDVLRAAFRIPEQLERLKRSQSQLESVFRIKSDRIDRQSSSKMDTSLALISFLVVFSAWIDGHDYIGTWVNELGESNVHLLQRLLFLLVLFIAAFAVFYLLGDRIRDRLRRIADWFRARKRERGKKKARR